MTVFEIMTLITFMGGIFLLALRSAEFLRNSKVTAISPARLAITRHN